MVVDHETGEIISINVGQAHARHDRIKKLVGDFEHTFLELGKELYEMEDGKEYRALGYDTFEEYLASPEVHTSRSLAFMMKGIHKRFVLELKVQAPGLLEAGHTRLELIRSRVDEDNVNDLLARAQTLSSRDLATEMGLGKSSKVGRTTRTVVPKSTPTPPMTADEKIAAHADLFGGGDGGMIPGPKYAGLARDFKGRWEQWLKTGAINKDSDVVITVQIKRRGE